MKNIVKKYDVGILIILTIFMMVSLLIIYFGWGNRIFSYNNCYQYFYNHGFDFLISLFFIAIGLYSWYLYIIRSMIKPKDKILYLNNIEKGKGTTHEYDYYVFLDERGKQYFYPKLYDIDYKTKKFYKVSKKGTEIIKIIGGTTKKFKVKKYQETFFLTWYSPNGKYERFFFLPILYIILIVCILSTIITTGFDKIYGVFFSFVPAYLIIYDLYYKFTEKNKKG